MVPYPYATGQAPPGVQEPVDLEAAKMQIANMRDYLDYEVPQRRTWSFLTGLGLGGLVGWAIGRQLRRR